MKKLLIAAMSAAVSGKKLHSPSAFVDYPALLKKAIDHQIHTLIFPVIQGISGEFAPEEELLSYWKALCFQSGMVLVRLEVVLNKIIRAFEEEGIPVVLLKGAVLKELYPVKETRTMGDVDIIIRPEHLEQVTERFKKEGYHKEYDSHGNVLFCRNNHITFEVFYALETVPNLWDHVIPLPEYKRVYRLSDTMSLYHLIAHLGKHLKYRGAGIRSLADIYLVMKHYRVDYDALFVFLEEEGYTSLFSALIFILRTELNFLGEPALGAGEEETGRALLAYMVQYGVYGIDYGDNVFFASQRSIGREKKNRIKSFVRIFFPQAEKLGEDYAYAKKHPFLLPLAWAHRVFDKMTKEKRTITASFQEMKQADEGLEKQIALLRKLGL